MKTLFQISVIVFFACQIGNLFAQTQQGSFRIGGEANYQKAKFSDDNHTRQLSFRPTVAYFVINNLSLGLTNSTSFLSGDSKNISYKNTDYAFGPEVRYYFTFGKWAVFPEVIFTLGKSLSESSGPDFMGYPTTSKAESSFQEFRSGAGLTYFVNSNIGVEGILFYQNNDSKYAGVANTSNGKAVTFSIGLQIYLNKNQ